MLQICYMSRATRFDEEMFRSILDISERLNHANDITGLLLSDGARYLQAIEGPRGPLRACFERIRHDARHHDIVTVTDNPIVRRQFGRWSMRHHHRQWSIGNGDFRKAVARDVDRVTDTRLQAMFIGFAALSR